MIRHIPNTITCLNLFSGCIATVMAYEANYPLALLFIVIGAIFDFFDGMTARLLNVPSPIGKELDSLADDISFGLAPAMIVFSLFKEVEYPAFLEGARAYIPYFAFLIAIFSAVRLAKFNIDQRQSDSFIGLNTPSNALFWASLVAGAHEFLVSPHFNALYLMALVMLFSWLLIAEIPFFALKFKTLGWQENKIRILFLTGCVLFLIFLGISGFAVSIVWYILLSLLVKKKQA